MKSAIYRGAVFHKRLTPKTHQFQYPLFMMYVDVDELDEVLSLSRFCGRSRWAPLRFVRGDFHGSPERSLKSEVFRTVREQTGRQLSGPVRVLAHWRTFGVNFNPLTVYYCFDESGETLDVVVAEVTNTPWLERRAYVLEVKGQAALDVRFEKTMTVSPFNPIDMDYHWQSSLPAEQLAVRIENYRDKEKVFYATLQLQRIELDAKAIRTHLLSYPFMTVRVVAGIYWQALKLFIKGVPFLGKDKTGKSSAPLNKVSNRMVK